MSVSVLVLVFAVTCYFVGLSCSGVGAGVYISLLMSVFFIVHSRVFLSYLDVLVNVNVYTNTYPLPS